MNVESGDARGAWVGSGYGQSYYIRSQRRTLLVTQQIYSVGQVSSVVSFPRTVGTLLLGGEYSISFPPFLYTSLGTYLDCFSMAI